MSRCRLLEHGAVVRVVRHPSTYGRWLRREQAAAARPVALGRAEPERPATDYFDQKPGWDRGDVREPELQ